jgi:hypothetical protein
MKTIQTDLIVGSWANVFNEWKNEEELENEVTQRVVNELRDGEAGGEPALIEGDREIASNRHGSINHPDVNNDHFLNAIGMTILINDANH